MFLQLAECLPKIQRRQTDVFSEWVAIFVSFIISIVSKHGANEDGEAWCIDMRWSQEWTLLEIDWKHFYDLFAYKHKF